MNHYCPRLCAIWMLATVASSPLLANPTSQDPRAILAIRTGEALPGDHLSPNYDAINKRCAAAQTMCDELWQKYEAKTLTLADARKVGPLVLLLHPLQRDAEYLRRRGETCGIDLELRCKEMNRRLQLSVREMLQLPGINLMAIDAQMQKTNSAGLKRVPQIENLAKRLPGQAEAALYEIIDDLNRNNVWFPERDTSLYFRPFIAPLQAAVAARQAQALEELQAIVDAGPNFTTLRGELSRAAGGIATSGQAMWNGESLAGPEMLAAWQQQAQTRQAAAKRSSSAVWAIEHVNNDGVAKHAPWLELQRKFASDEPQLLANIIQADAQRASGPEAAALYQRYLPVAAALCAAGPKPELQSALDPALKALAKKAGLDQDLEAYRAATEPLLAWRRFLARSQAKSLAARMSPLHDWCTKVCSPPYQPETIMLPEHPQIDLAMIVSTVDLVLPNMLPTGPAPAIVATDIVATGPNSGRWVARYHRRVYARLGAPPAAPLQAAVGNLERQLLVTPMAQPLTLTAATTLATARAGSFESAGGPVELVTLEPLLTRFIKLTDDEGRMLPLGPLPVESAGAPGGDAQGVQFLVVRCDVPQPLFWQHECFLLKP